MRQTITALLFVAVIAAGAYGLMYMPQIVAHFKKTSGPVACTTEAKLCPDGSSVGRSGPNCEFAPCPMPPAGTSTSQVPQDAVRFTAHINEKAEGGGIFIKPQEVVEDSRCPVDVQCIQAGTVLLKALYIPNVSTTLPVTFRLGTASTTKEHVVELVRVDPLRNSKKTIKPEDYIFTFEVRPR